MKTKKNSSRDSPRQHRTLLDFGELDPALLHVGPVESLLELFADVEVDARTHERRLVVAAAVPGAYARAQLKRMCPSARRPSSH